VRAILFAGQYKAPSASSPSTPVSIGKGKGGKGLKGSQSHATHPSNGNWRDQASASQVGLNERVQGTFRGKGKNGAARAEASH
jgi:hypothetical protein